MRDRVVALLRGNGRSRSVVLRRLLAAALVLVAAVIALRPQPGTATILVAAHDLRPGATLTPSDVRTRPVPAELVPSGALRRPADVDGRVLTGAARGGEPITDVRLLGDELARLLAPREGTATVPVRLADPDVVRVLAPGSVVDVVGVDGPDGRPTVLAEQASVLAVLDEHAGSGLGATSRGQQGRLIVVLLPRAAATQVAAASLSQSLTVTLR